jgi:hypothetical protein
MKKTFFNANFTTICDSPFFLIMRVYICNTIDYIAFFVLCLASFPKKKLRASLIYTLGKDDSLHQTQEVVINALVAQKTSYYGIMKKNYLKENETTSLNSFLSKKATFSVYQMHPYEFFEPVVPKFQTLLQLL